MAAILYFATTMPANFVATLVYHEKISCMNIEDLFFYHFIRNSWIKFDVHKIYPKSI